MFFEFGFVFVVFGLQDSLESFPSCLLDALETKCLFILLLKFLLSLPPANRIINFKLHRELDALSPIRNIAPNTMVKQRLMQVDLPFLCAQIVNEG